MALSQRLEYSMRVLNWRRFLLPAIFGIVCLATSAWGQDRGFGLGLIVGEPTGLSAKLWIADGSAIDAAAAWSFGKTSAFHFHADYLLHFLDVIDVQKGRVPLYLGVGARVKLEADIRIGIRIPVGIMYLFESVPIDLFLEVVPLLDLFPATEFTANAGIGIRYYFAAAK
jgi:hypothetical protein